jgi:hypothetical protein
MDLEEALNAANHDPNVHGILIYYPCFGAAPSFYGSFLAFFASVDAIYVPFLNEFTCTKAD